MNKIETNNIILLEGFNIVGKSEYIDKQLPHYYDLYNNSYFCKTISDITKSPKWIADSEVIDVVEKLISGSNKSNLMNLNLIINQGIFSDYVNSRIFSNKNLDTKILDLYKNNSFFKDYISHIYIRHHDINTAQFIYESAKLNELIPVFRTFEDYWKMYSYANLLFKEVYDYIGIQPIIFETMTDMTWRESNDF